MAADLQFLGDLDFGVIAGTQQRPRLFQITFMVSHLWGRSMDTDSYDGKATRFYRPGDNDYGRSIFDVRQRLVVSLNYELHLEKA